LSFVEKCTAVSEDLVKILALLTIRLELNSRNFQAIGIFYQVFRRGICIFLQVADFD